MNVEKKNKILRLLCCGFWLMISTPLDYPAKAKNLTPSLHLPLSQSKQGEVVGVRSFCSNQNLETLTAELLRDLPSYANRVTQRARRLRRTADIYSYVLVAGRPEFQPLPLNPSGYTRNSLKTSSEGVEQVFFTTLERQYIKRQAIQLQQFHWLFLTKAESGWRFVMMFSQTGTYPKNQPPTPPRDSSNGVLGQAISHWLRDCHADSIRTSFRKSG